MPAKKTAPKRKSGPKPRKRTFDLNVQIPLVSGKAPPHLVRENVSYILNVFLGDYMRLQGRKPKFGKISCDGVTIPREH